MIHIYRLMLRTEEFRERAGAVTVIQARGDLSTQQSSKSELSCVHVFLHCNLLKKEKYILIAL